MLLRLLLLRKARRRRREAARGPAGPEAVSHGRLLLLLLLERRGNGSRSRVEVVSVGRALHFDATDGAGSVAPVCRRRRSRSRRREHPPVELRVDHGQRREDAGLDPRQRDDGVPRAALGQTVFVRSFVFRTEFEK